MGASDRPDIVVIVMDCVRAQNLPCYGYSSPTAPRICDWSTDGVRFDNAISAAEQTLSSTASLFTGVYPSTHRLWMTGDKLDKRFHTLAGALSRGGYETCCINCNNPYVSPFTDMPRGFDQYECAFPRLRRWATALRGYRARANLAVDERTDREPEPVDIGQAKSLREEVAERLDSRANRLRWNLTRFVDGGGRAALRRASSLIRAKRPRSPRFVYVHLMETHTRYLPPLGHRGRFLPDLRRRRPWRVNQDPLPYIAGAAKMDALDFSIVEGLYNGALHYTDCLFGEFMSRLRRCGALDNTIVVLTADHGESFGEHGLLGHGQCVYDTVVRVPLLVWGPVVPSTLRGRATNDPVQNVDLTASVLDWAEVRDDPIRDQLEGQPLPLDGAGTRTFAVSQTVRAFEWQHLPALDELGLTRRGGVGLRTRSHKFVWNTSGREELYALESDPHENKNVADVENTPREELHAVIAPFVTRFKTAHDDLLERLERGPSKPIEAGVQARLRELGYL